MVHSEIDNTTELIAKWSKPSGGDSISSYWVIWNSIDNSHEKNRANVLHATGRSDYDYTISDLHPGTTYQVKVESRNSADRGSFTAYVTIATGKNTPTVFRTYTLLQGVSLISMSTKFQMIVLQNVST